MLTVTLADLRFRYRQFLIAVVGAGVVLAMAILMAGLAAGFGVEINQTVGGVHADRWVLSEKSKGRLTAVSTFPQSTVATIARSNGVRAAAGLVFLPQEAARINGKTVTVNVMGVPTHGLGAPKADSGGSLATAGQAVTDPHVGAKIGSVMKVGSTTLHVVGTINHRTLDGGTPMVFMTLTDAQRIAFGGRPVVTAVVTTGVPRHVPSGLQAMTAQRVESQTLETLASAISSIENSRTLLWIVATIIVAALIYVSALQRVRDFAVLKALGSSSAALFGSLCMQAVLVTLIAAAFAAAACNFMKGVFSQPVAIPTSAFVTLPIVAIVVGIVSSLVALRTATSADPVAAFGG